MMMLMVPPANCNSKLEVELQVGPGRQGGGRVFICEINKNYSLSRAASGNTPVGHVATPEHIHVRCFQTEP